MSKKNDIIDKSQSSDRKGLIYTCKLGWIDLGHARADGVSRLWTDIKSEAKTSKDNKGYKVTYAQTMTPYGVYLGGPSRSYYIKKGLSLLEKEAIALSIFIEVSLKFEDYQSLPIFKIASKSGFSSEDLVSDLLGFYRAVRPSMTYLLLAQPVSKEAAVKIWETYGDVGDTKNTSFGGCFLYPCPECDNTISGPICVPLPDWLNTIKPAIKGQLYRNWDDFSDAGD